MSVDQKIPDGIHFNMQEEEYHAVPRLSASGIKRMMVSPLDFYMSSWMNPDRTEKQTSALRLGKAYHKLILEGEGAFDEAYAVEPDQSEYEDLLSCGDDYRAFLVEHGAKKSGSNAELIGRIREIDAVVPIWPEILREFTESLCGRLSLSRENWAEIQRARFIIRNMPSAKKAFGNGAPEVSIFWTNKDGVRMKSRLDYLQAKTILDVKSFANVMDKDVVSAITSTIARYRYDVQAVIYSDGMEAVKKLYAERGNAIVSGVHPDSLPRNWLDNAMSAKDHRFFFVFIQTGDVPNLVIREFRRAELYGGGGMTTNAYWTSAVAGYRRSCEIFKRCMEEYGPDVPWVTDYGIRAFVDSDFPIWLLDQG